MTKVESVKHNLICYYNILAIFDSLPTLTTNSALMAIRKHVLFEITNHYILAWISDYKNFIAI